MYSEIKPEIRYLKDLKGIVFDEKVIKKFGGNTKLYYIYRGLKFFNGIRYDITVIPGIIINKKYNKTFGHFHNKNFREIYKVLEGTAIFYLQDKAAKKISIIKAKKNDFVVIPSGFGHIANNPSKKILIMGNFVSEKCKNDYGFFKKMKGPAYFYTKNGWMKNKNYKNLPKIKFEKPLKNLPKDWKKILSEK